MYVDIASLRNNDLSLRSTVQSGGGAENQSLKYVMDKYVIVLLLAYYVRSNMKDPPQITSLVLNSS